MAEYQGVDVQNPKIREYIINMVKQDKSTEEIMRVVGMPAEVVEQVRRDVKKGRV